MTRPTGRRIAILIVAYRGNECLRPCLDSVLESEVGSDVVDLFVLDNNCPQHCCAGLQEQYLSVRVLFSAENRGFAGGNNLGWTMIQATGVQYDYLMLLNQDTTVKPDAIQYVVRYLDQHPEAGAAQSLLLLDPESDLINTAGNQSHFLGFGFPTRYRETYQRVPEQSGQLFNSGEIGYASGAAVLLRCDLLHRIGLFEESMFMYLEDADLSWKLRSIGYPPHLCAESVVLHQYKFNDGFQYLRYLEQNRWWLMLVYYKWRTLAVIFPAAMLMELGQIYFATVNGRLVEKWTAITFCLSRAGVRTIWRHRKETQARRTITDKELMRLMVGEIHSPHLKGFLVNRIASPIFAMYWKGMRWFIRW